MQFVTQVEWMRLVDLRGVQAVRDPGPAVATPPVATSLSQQGSSFFLTGTQNRETLWRGKRGVFMMDLLFGCLAIGGGAVAGLLLIVLCATAERRGKAPDAKEGAGGAKPVQ